jgi:hypothetical protein
VVLSSFGGSTAIGTEDFQTQPDKKVVSFGTSDHKEEAKKAPENSKISMSFDTNQEVGGRVFST